MAKATLKKLQAVVDTLAPEFEIVKGEGYFYFSMKDTASNAKYPESIYIYAMNQMTLEEWTEYLEGHLGEQKCTH